MTIEPFYRDDGEVPLQQGDLVLAPVSFLTGPDVGLPARWRGLDQARAPLAFGQEPELRPVDVGAGYAPAMIVTHDCHLDKELLEAYERLRKQGMRKDDALAEAEADPDLDRFLSVSPVVDLASLRATPDAVASQSVIGLFGVPDLVRANLSGVAVDLTLRATIDRHTIVARLASLTEPARTSLRYALARSDALRTPSIGFELEQAVGKRIRSLRAASGNPLLVVLELSDGSEISLVQRPGPVAQGGPARTKAPRRR